MMMELGFLSKVLEVSKEDNTDREVEVEVASAWVGFVGSLVFSEVKVERAG